MNKKFGGGGDLIGLAGRLLLVSPAQSFVVFWFRRDPWPYYCSFQDTSVFWIGASSSTRGRVWLLLSTTADLSLLGTANRVLSSHYILSIWCDADRREITAFNSSSIFACVSAAAGTCLPSCCLATIGRETQTTRRFHMPYFIFSLLSFLILKE
jgi:hypothetical protein